MKITIEIDDQSVAEMEAEAAESGLTLPQVAEIHIRALRASIDNPDLPADFVKGILFALKEKGFQEYKFDSPPTWIDDLDKREKWPIWALSPPAARLTPAQIGRFVTSQHLFMNRSRGMKATSVYPRIVGVVGATGLTNC